MSCRLLAFCIFCWHWFAKQMLIAGWDVVNVRKERLMNENLGLSFISLVFSFRILREPAFLNAFFLLKEFQNGPKQRETSDCGEATPESTLNEECAYHASESEQEKNPPRACTEIVLCLDDHWVKGADNQKGTKSYQDTFEVHSPLFNRCLPYPQHRLSCGECEVCEVSCPQCLL